MNDWCISDHNAILIQMMYDGMREMRVLNVSKRWMCKNVSWEEYELELGEIARTRCMSVFYETNVERMVERVTDWIRELNEEYMKDRVRQRERKNLVLLRVRCKSVGGYGRERGRNAERMCRKEWLNIREV